MAESASTPHNFRERASRKIVAYFESVQSFAESIKPYITGEQVEDVLWRTLIANQTATGWPVSEEYGDYYRSWVALLNETAVCTMPETLTDAKMERVLPCKSRQTNILSHLK
jgi:hypothetical protein